MAAARVAANDCRNAELGNGPVAFLHSIAKGNKAPEIVHGEHRYYGSCFNAPLFIVSTQLGVLNILYMSCRRSLPL